MEFRVKRLSIGILGTAVLLLASCDSTETKKTSRPPVQAMAPTVTTQMGQQQPSTTPAPPVSAATATPAAPGQVAQQQAKPQDQPSSQSPIQASPQAQAPQETEKGDPVPAIVAEAEKAYQAGQEALKAHNTDAAKENFNHAI